MMRGASVSRADIAYAAAVWVFGVGVFGPVQTVSAQSSLGGAEWPHMVTVNGAKVVVHQPQAIEWPEHRTLTTRQAFAVTPAGAKTAALGTAEVSFATYTDAVSNQIFLSDAKLLAAHFGALDDEQAARLEQQIKAALADGPPAAVPLASVLPSLRQSARPEEAELNNDPPVIYHSESPVSLVVLDGEPIVAPAGHSGLSFVVNTNWDLFTDGESWYLLDNGTWMMADAYEGPYQPVTRLPVAFSLIPADANFATARKAVPPPANRPLIVPVVLVSTKPAEVIVTTGAPQLETVSGTRLQVVKNTNSMLFLDPADARFFLLVSGRWFAAGSLDGPWEFASNDLPADFSMISPRDAQARVLASVPGTVQAQLAERLAQVPRQATFKKDHARLTVAYGGPPTFRPIPGVSVQYSVNTSFQVIQAGGRYYVCYLGAWFDGPDANGPWALAETVPPEIYAIPPASPLYNVTFVKVYDVTPATVTYGYTAGYVISFATSGGLVHGTGYYYPPAVSLGEIPVYYPYAYTYAGNLGYNTSADAWAPGGAVYAPYGGAAKTVATYNPVLGAYGTGTAIYGPHGGVGGFSYYHHSTGGYARDSGPWAGAGGSDYNPRTGLSQNTNPYYRWGSDTLSVPSRTAVTRGAANWRRASWQRGGKPQDIYAGSDGAAYQHTSKGWSRWADGQWQPINPPPLTASTTDVAVTAEPAARDISGYSQLEQDREARLVASERSGGAR